ncbi:Dabb family protein [Marinimicrobium sp. ARAG 43.8]|uniref:Dabb family protein n=1 Tax=Marinimicrobium sp. ARAG 43.8 TaxID=3418719 RepID=UPI003CEE0521
MLKNVGLFASSLLLVCSVVGAAHADEPIRHIVAFKYAEDASEADIQRLTDAFSGLQDTIPGIVSFEHGVNNSPEGLNKGFEHVYVMTFEDEEARDTYLPHPEHKKFGALLEQLNIVEDAFVIDYTLKD